MNSSVRCNSRIKSRKNCKDPERISKIKPSIDKCN